MLQRWEIDLLARVGLVACDDDDQLLIIGSSPAVVEQG
jgi:hypothetical protein